MRGYLAGLLVMVTSISIGCSSQSDTSTSVGTTPAVNDLVAPIASALAAIEGDGALLFSTSEADCVATAVVEQVASDRLIELGADDGTDLTGLAWNAGERDQIFATMRNCVDLLAQLETFFAGDPALSAEQVTCIAQSYLNSDVFPEALFSTAPDPDLDAKVDAHLASAYDTCTAA